MPPVSPRRESQKIGAEVKEPHPGLPHGAATLLTSVERSTTMWEQAPEAIQYQRHSER